MITIIIFALLSTGLFLWYVHKEIGIEWQDVLFSILPGILGAMVGMGICLLLPARMEVRSTEYGIESLQDNNSQTGRFLLGSGYMEGRMKYVFYYKTNGGFRMKQVDHDNALILYSDTPKVVYNKEKPTDALINWFAYDSPSEWFEIYVPKGTITNEFRLDAR